MKRREVPGVESLERYPTVAFGAVLLGLATGLVLHFVVISNQHLWLDFVLKAATLLLLLPGSLVTALVGGKELAGSVPGLLVAAAVTLPIYLLLGRRHVSESGPLLDRRSFLKAGLGTAAAVAGTGAYGALAGRFDIETTSYPLVLRDLPRQLEGLRLVLLADLHCGPYNRPHFVRESVRLANELRPDLVLLPGDFVHASAEYFPEAAELLALLRPRIASLGTLGNHDHWEGADRARELLPQAGVRLIDNSRLFVTPSRELVGEAPDQGLCLAGLGDLWEDLTDLEAALGGVPRGMPRLLLEHNPDILEEPSLMGSKHRVDLILAGHTHGGQIAAPLYGPLFVPSKFGARYAAGWVKGPTCAAYVTRGIGTVGVPLRLFAPPEVTLFELRSG